MAVERTKCKTVRKKGWDDAEVESGIFWVFFDRRIKGFWSLKLLVKVGTCLVRGGMSFPLQTHQR